MDTPHLDNFIAFCRRRDPGLRTAADLAYAELMVLKSRCETSCEPSSVAASAVHATIQVVNKAEPKKLFAVGDLVRYDKGATAFMRIDEHVWKPDTRKWAVVGTHVHGMTLNKIWSMEEDCTPAAEMDRIRLMHLRGVRHELLKAPVPSSTELRLL